MILVYMFMDKLYAYTLRKQIFESARGTNCLLSWINNEAKLILCQIGDTVEKDYVCVEFF